MSDDAMKKLENKIGQTVTASYIWSGKQKEEKGILKLVRPYNEIGIEQDTGGKIPLETFISFIGTSRALQKVATEKGEIIYENKLISPDHDVTAEKVFEIAKATFGDEVAERFRPQKKTD